MKFVTDIWHPNGEYMHVGYMCTCYVRMVYLKVSCSKFPREGGQSKTFRIFVGILSLTHISLLSRESKFWWH